MQFKNVDPAIGGMVFLLAVGVGMLVLLFISRHKVKEERGLSPVFQAICSGRIGYFLHSGLPAIRFSIYENFLVISFLSASVIPFSDIARVSIERSLLGRCLLIELKDDRSYLLRVKKPEDVLKLIQQDLRDLR